MVGRARRPSGEPAVVASSRRGAGPRRRQAPGGCAARWDCATDPTRTRSYADADSRGTPPTRAHPVMRVRADWPSASQHAARASRRTRAAAVTRSRARGAGGGPEDGVPGRVAARPIRQDRAGNHAEEMLGARRERRPVDQPRERPDEREQVVAVDAVAQGAIPGVSADRLPDPGVATVHRRISLRRSARGRRSSAARARDASRSESTSTATTCAPRVGAGANRARAARAAGPVGRSFAVFERPTGSVRCPATSGSMTASRCCGPTEPAFVSRTRCGL